MTAPAANAIVTVADIAVPAWLAPRELPAATPARVEHAREGSAYLLRDRQFRITATGYEQWFRLATKIVERSGLEGNGQISIDYNPHFETLTVHHIHIIREGRVIDVTKTSPFRVVEREDSLDDGIVSGTLRAITNLRDVRVGDIVDFATVTTTRSTLWPGQFYQHLSQRFSDPLAAHGLRIVFPRTVALYSKAFNSSIRFAERISGDMTEWDWIEFDAPGQTGEDGVPDSAHQFGMVDLSTMRTWGEVAAWGAPLYAGDIALPAAFRARLDVIAANTPAPADRLTAVTRYVQDNIRYVGEELGEGSYVPRPPALVLERGYGDCKDKSLLLTVALRYLGITAVPALVDADGADDLPEHLPSPLLFDHVIVRAVLDGKVLWLDPTGTHRGGRGAGIVPSDFGYALPLVAGQDGLERMRGYVARAGRIAALEQFTVDENGETPLLLHVETRYTDARADGMRGRAAEVAAKGVAKENLDFYRKRFAGLVESKPLEIVDDRDANLLIMHENYSLSKRDFDKEKLVETLETRAYLVSDLLPDRQAGPRLQPLAVPGPFEREQVIELTVKDRKLGLLDSIDRSAAGIRFTRQSSQNGAFTRVTYRLTAGERQAVSPADAEGVYALSDTIKDEVGTEYYLQKSDRLSAKKDSDLDPAVMAPILADVKKVSALLEKNDEPSAIEGLTLLNTVLPKVARPSREAGMLDGLKGALLAQLRRPVPALAAFQSATAQYEGNPPVYRLWIAFEIDHGTPQGVLAALRRTVQVQPAVVAALDPDWVPMIGQKLRPLPPTERETLWQDMTILLVDGGWQMSPRTARGTGMLDLAITAHSRRGELAAARAGLAMMPSASGLAGLALDRRHQALWPDIDRLAVAGFRRNLEADLARAASAAKTAPRDAKAVLAYMQQLRAIGRATDATAIGKPLATDKAFIETVGDDGFWLVNEYAQALRWAGRPDEAIATLDGLLALGVDAYPSLVSMAINKGLLLNDAGRQEQALATLNALETAHAGQISSFGRMFIWSGQACALRALSRPEEARPIEAKLAAKPDDNWGAVTRTAACRGDVQAIAEMLIKRIQAEDARIGVLALYVNFLTRDTLLPYEATLQKAMTAALHMPAVEAEFRKHGRVIDYAGNRTGWPDY